MLLLLYLINFIFEFHKMSLIGKNQIENKNKKKIIPDNIVNSI
jgi:hypothetical protein